MMAVTDDQIQSAALAAGFTLKPQPDGGMALHWPGDTYTWLSVISDDIDRDALIFEADGAEELRSI